jgi:hypothetical protein
VPKSGTRPPGECGERGHIVRSVRRGREPKTRDSGWWLSECGGAGARRGEVARSLTSELLLLLPRAAHLRLQQADLIDAPVIDQCTTSPFLEVGGVLRSCKKGEEPTVTAF